MKIEKTTWTAKWDFHTDYHIQIILDNNVLASIELEENEEAFHIKSLYVNEMYRNKGLATELLEIAILTYISKNEKYKQLFLKVRSDNKVAFDMYKKYGFEVHSTEDYGDLLEYYTWMEYKTK